MSVMSIAVLYVVPMNLTLMLMLQHYMLDSIGVPNIFVYVVPTNLTLMCVFFQSLGFVPFSDTSIHVCNLLFDYSINALYSS